MKKHEKYHVELKPSVLPISATGMSLDRSRFFALVSRTASCYWRGEKPVSILKRYRNERFAVWAEPRAAENPRGELDLKNCVAMMIFDRFFRGVSSAAAFDPLVRRTSRHFVFSCCRL